MIELQIFRRAAIDTFSAAQCDESRAALPVLPNFVVHSEQ